MVTEYEWRQNVNRFAEGGELFDYIQKLKVVSPEMSADVMRQLLSAIAYCHERGIVHRDLKPENILLSSKDTSKLFIKIIDFGTAGWYTSDTKMTQIMGSAYYIAPEVLGHSYNEKCDVWSCGVILYVLLSGQVPFNGRTDEDVMRAVKKAQFSFSRNLSYHLNRSHLEIH